MNIGKIEDYRDELLNCFKNKALVPVVGSGISCGASARKGNVPSGSEFRRIMINAVIESMNATEDEKRKIEQMPFSSICELYEDDENVDKDARITYMKNNFQNVVINDYRKVFFKIGWPYIYTLNIDDAIENNSEYDYVVISNRGVNNDIYNDNKCVIKLHGDIKEIITYPNSDCRVFSSKEYADSLIKNVSLLNKLKNDFVYQNILFIGCGLDDEIDLKTLSEIPISSENAVTTKKYIFVKGEPSRLKQAELKVYGITDVVCFDNFQEMYDSLFDIWKESEKISDDELSMYQNIPIKSLPQDEDSNAGYFYYCKYLNDLKKHVITIPYFFIQRDISEKILNNIGMHKIHIVYGNRVSGKSYLLIDLYQRIKDRQKLFFDGRERINDDAFNKLIEMTNAVIIFDIGSLSRNQIDMLLLSAATVRKNCSDVVFVLNKSDNDVTGLIKLRIKELRLDKNMIINYDLSNKLNKKESDDINSRLPYSSLPPFEIKHSIIDNLIAAGHMMNKSGKFQNISLGYNMNYKELALLIVLATKEKIYSLDIVKFGFEQEIERALQRYQPYIDIMSADIIEKDSSDLSSTKYIVNAQYWLCRALGDFAINKNNYSTIIDAYKYIIDRLKANAGTEKYKQYKACREYILFDTINRVFLNEKGGQLPLIAHLYGEMHKLLANDVHFLHQNAKCYFRFSFYERNTEQEKYLRDALTMSKISAKMLENEYEENRNDKILISLAHVQYTIASILSEMCKRHKYEDIEEVRCAIEAIYLALYSPYNIDDYKDSHRSFSSTAISNMLLDMYSPSINVQLDNDLNRKLSDIFSQIRQ